VHTERVARITVNAWLLRVDSRDQILVTRVLSQLEFGAAENTGRFYKWNIGDLGQY
jgi:hypothetical protein